MHGPHRRSCPASAAADVHQAGAVGGRADLAPDEVTDASLSRSMAADVSEFLIANVPPNPQHVSARRQVDQVEAAHISQQFGVASPIPSCLSEWQVGW